MHRIGLLVLATTTTTTTPLPYPLQQQSTTELELAERVTALEKKLFDLEQTNKNLDNTTRNLGSKVYTLDLRDLPQKIDEAVSENFKEVVQIALQAPLRDRFRDLSEEDMKEMLHQRIGMSFSLKRISLVRDKVMINILLLLYQIQIKANALATTYQAPAENSLLEKTRDMRTFMNWYCQKMGKTELTQADLEGQAYEVVKPFYLDVVHLQFQMEECHKMLTDQID
ncbi:hypothetical protein Tco_1123400 [Tanacetum coccineum]|uniref:Uncharacterized protein n=1 Tax=Tanacetum coccineum TaxID=301880 RepID=A0ABQ5J4P5_9ASTR